MIFISSLLEHFKSEICLNVSAETDGLGANEQLLKGGKTYRPIVLNNNNNNMSQCSRIFKQIWFWHFLRDAEEINNLRGRYICTVCQMLLWLRYQTINSDCILLGQSTDSCNCKDILFSSFIQEASHQVITLCWSHCPVRVSRGVGMCDARWCVWLFRDGIGIPAGAETWEALLCSAPLRLPLCVSGRGNRVKSESGGEEDYLVKGWVDTFLEKGW